MNKCELCEGDINPAPLPMEAETGRFCEGCLILGPELCFTEVKGTLAPLPLPEHYPLALHWMVVLRHLLEARSVELPPEGWDELERLEELEHQAIHSLLAATGRMRFWTDVAIEDRQSAPRESQMLSDLRRLHDDALHDARQE